MPAGNLPDASTSAEGISEFATAAEFRTGTDTARSLVVSEVWSAAAVSALTDGASIAVNLANGFDFGGALSPAPGLKVVNNMHRLFHSFPRIQLRKLRAIRTIATSAAIIARLSALTE
jgi:hypothetical protein